MPYVYPFIHICTYRLHIWLKIYGWRQLCIYAYIVLPSVRPLFGMAYIRSCGVDLAVMGIYLLGALSGSLSRVISVSYYLSLSICIPNRGPYGVCGGVDKMFW
jgi:hypothetical protein